MKKLLLFSLLFIGILVNSGAQTAPAFWQDIVAFKHQDSVQPPPARPILFIGSSSFRMWDELNSYFPGYPVLNRGFGGSQLTDLIRYSYDILFPYKPKQVVIYCGENDLASADSLSPEEVCKRFITLFRMIRTNLPGVPVAYVSIKPSPSRAALQYKMKNANQQIKAFIASQKKAAFIDIYTPMLTPDGKMREELYKEDRLHMKPEGYAIWKKKITPYLVK